MRPLNFDKFSIVLSIKAFQSFQQEIYEWGCFPIPHQNLLLANFLINVLSLAIFLFVKSNIFHIFRKSVYKSIFINYFCEYFAHFLIGQFILFLNKMEFSINKKIM